LSNFVNICLFKTVSQTDGIGNGPTIFSCTGDHTSRLANCNTTVAQQQLTANTPAGMTVNWHSIVLNGSSWWNTGSVWMLWSGGNANRYVDTAHAREDGDGHLAGRHAGLPPAGAVSSPSTLTVNVIDPAVINVDWSVDGAVVATNGGITFDVAGRALSSGPHTIAAKAYDNATTDLVRQVPGTTWGRMNWARSVQTVTWTVTIP